MFKKLALAGFLWCLFSCGAWAQNTTCATRIPGDSSNACASTAFVQTAVTTNPGLTIGTTVINGGTTGLCLYDNAGILGVQTCGSGGGGGTPTTKQCWNLAASGGCGTLTAGQTSFTLTSPPATTAYLLVYEDAAWQNTTYTLSGSTLTLTAVPSGVNEVEVVSIGSGGSPTLANNNVLANTSGSSAGGVSTPVTTLFDSLCSTTVGQFWVRMTGAWGCSLAGYIDPGWYGADYTGAADSTTALNAAILAAQNAGLKIFMRGGVLVASGTLNNTAPAIIEGSGIGVTFLNLGGSPGLKVDYGATLVNGGGFRDFTVTGTTNGADLIDLGTASDQLLNYRARDAMIIPATSGVGLHLISTIQTHTDNLVYSLPNANSVGREVENQFHGDNGDNVFEGDVFGGNYPTVTGTTGSLWKSGGGYYEHHFKYNEVQFPEVFTLATGVQTADVDIGPGSVEGAAGNSTVFSQQTANSGTLLNVHLHDIQYSPGYGNVSSIVFAANASTTQAWLFNVSVQNCTGSEYTTTGGATSNFISADWMGGYTFTNNNVMAATGVTVNSMVIGAHSTAGLIGITNKIPNGGTVNAANNGSSATEIAPF